MRINYRKHSYRICKALTDSPFEWMEARVTHLVRDRAGSYGGVRSFLGVSEETVHGVGLEGEMQPRGRKRVSIIEYRFTAD